MTLSMYFNTRSFLVNFFHISYIFYEKFNNPERTIENLLVEAPTLHLISDVMIYKNGVFNDKKINFFPKK